MGGKIVGKFEMLKWKIVHLVEHCIDDVESFRSPPKMQRGAKNEREDDRSRGQRIEAQSVNM